MSDYKENQWQYRMRARAYRFVPGYGRFNLGIKKFKRTGASQEYIRIFKANAWASLLRK